MVTLYNMLFKQNSYLFCAKYFLQSYLFSAARFYAKWKLGDLFLLNPNTYHAQTCVIKIWFELNKIYVVYSCYVALKHALIQRRTREMFYILLFSLQYQRLWETVI